MLLDCILGEASFPGNLFSVSSPGWREREREKERERDKEKEHCGVSFL
jgi:hypothetical protein